MTDDSILKPTFEVEELGKIEPGNLVRFRGRSGRDELALTGCGDSIRYLTQLSSKGDQITPITFLETDEGRTGAVARKFPRWRIEPIDVVVGDAANKVGVGVILVEPSATRMVANVAIKGGQGYQTAMCLDTGIIMDHEKYDKMISAARYVAITKWKLWVPRFSDGVEPAWEVAYEFPRPKG